MKKIDNFKIVFGLLLFAAVLGTLFLPIMPQRASADSTFTQYSDGSFDYWIYNDGTADIRKYNGNAEKVVIPSEVKGNKVVAIDGAFRLNKSLKEVVIPDTVTRLYGSFASCTALEKVTLPEYADYVFGAFSGCTSLKSITIPAGWSKDFDYNEGNQELFVRSGLTSVVFEEGTTAIHNHMFDGCEQLKTVEMPDTVTVIGEYAFGDCAKLVVDLPKNLEELRNHAFYNCKSITKLTIPKSLTKTTTVRGVYNYFEGTSLKEVTIEEGATIIPGSLFRNCPLITEVTIPDSVTEIGVSAFDGCTGMKTLRLTDSVKTIGYDPWKNSFPNIEDIYLTATAGGTPMKVYELLGTGEDKHTFEADNTKVVTISSSKAELTFIGAGTAKIKDSTGKAKRVLHVTVEGSKRKLADCTITLPQTTFIATGSPVTARVMAYDGKDRILKDTDYTLSYANHTAVGKASVTVTGKGSYTGSVTLEYNLVPITNSIADISVNGKKITVTWNIIKDVSGYEIYYSSKESGTYKLLATVTDESYYTTTKLSEGMYVKIRSYQTVDGTKYYSEYSSIHKL
jgi:hypothetical protein